jgi:hypothetical protein
MDMGNGKFGEVPQHIQDAFNEMRDEGSLLRVFKIGEELEIRGSKFKVEAIYEDGRMTLRLQKRALGV